jgi:hypothetical protein
MIHRHCRHVARDSREHAVALLDTLNAAAVDFHGRSAVVQTGARRRPGQPKQRFSKGISEAL